MASSASRSWVQGATHVALTVPSGNCVTSAILLMRQPCRNASETRWRRSALARKGPRAVAPLLHRDRRSKVDRRSASFSLKAAMSWAALARVAAAGRARLRQSMSNQPSAFGAARIEARGIRPRVRVGLENDSSGSSALRRIAEAARTVCDEFVVQLLERPLLADARPLDERGQAAYTAASDCELRLPRLHDHRQ